MWLSLIWFILVLFLCWNLFWTIANLRIKCVTETKSIFVMFYKNLKSSFSTWLTHLTLYILGISGPRCAAWYERANFKGRNWVWSSHLKVSYFQTEFMKSSFLPKYKWKIVRISALCSEGRNSDNFLLVFWKKQWLHKFILKLTDLYSHVVFPQ